jgi:beta-glucuronidase
VRKGSSTTLARDGLVGAASGSAGPLPNVRQLLASSALVVAGLLMAAPGTLAADTPSERALYRDGPSGRHLLDGVWYGRPDPADRGLKARLHRSPSLSGWAQTAVPNAANAGDFSESSYFGSVHWYRKDFNLPDSTGSQSWILRFESVNYEATVWLNGRLLGRHKGAYLPFELPASGLRRRRVNRLVVRVDSRRGPLDVPPLAIRRDARLVGGWWNYTGMLREVYLRRIDTFDLRDVFVRPTIACRTCPATVAVDLALTNVRGFDGLARVEGRIDGRSLRFSPREALKKRPRRTDRPPGAPIRVPGRATRLLHARVKLSEPRLWSPESPHLYRMALWVRNDEGEIIQRYTLHSGIRDIRVSRFGRVLLNYRPVGLRGASMHEDDPVRGAALHPSDIRRNVELLRELGATMTRSHYPLHPLTLELADRHGIVVWAEIPVYQMQDRLFRVSRVRSQGLRALREMIFRDRNHPSVMVWSVGNENTSRPGVGFQAYVRRAKRVARRLDPTRLVGLAFPGYPTVGKQPLYEEIDALGMNDYFGWYEGPGGSIAAREGLEPFLDQLHAYYPRQALFVTELGAEANRSGPAQEQGTFEFQRDFLAYHLGVFARKPFVNGALVWILRDFRVKPGYDGGNPHPRPPGNHKGLVDDFGTKKPGFLTVQELLKHQPQFP